MNKRTVRVFMAGMITASALDYWAYRRVIRQNLKMVSDGLDLGEVLVKVAAETCPAIFVDKRVRAVINKHQFEQIVRDF